MSTTVNSSTKLINIETNAYPVYLAQVRAETGISFGAEPDEDQVLAMGYAVVIQVDKPTGMVATEGPPEEIDGQYIQNWITRPYNEDELAAMLAAAQDVRYKTLEDLFIRTLEKGALYTWPDGAEEHIQLRDGDRANLTAIGARSDRKITLGITEDEYLGFITYENNWKPLTPEQGRAMTDYAYEAYLTFLMRRRALKDQIDAANNYPLLGYVGGIRIATGADLVVPTASYNRPTAPWLIT